jgi:hypothetical protein
MHVEVDACFHTEVTHDYKRCSDFSVVRNVCRRTSYFDTKLGKKSEFYAAKHTLLPFSYLRWRS